MDINKVISGLASSGVLGGLAGGAVSGAVMGNKKARKTAGTLLKVGGVAALGGLAWKAYQGYQASQGGGVSTGPESPAPSPRDTRSRDPVWQGLTEERFALAQGQDAESNGVLLLQAMATAANSDGHLDVMERQRILQRADGLSLAPDEKALVFDLLNSPLSLAQLCERVDCPELASEVYLSSLLVIDHDAPEAKLYLEALAFRLGLPSALVTQLHRAVEEEAAMAMQDSGAAA